MEHLGYNSTTSGWWLTYPSKKYEFISWDHYYHYSQYIESHKSHVPNNQAVLPCRIEPVALIHHDSSHIWHPCAPVLLWHTLGAPDRLALTATTDIPKRTDFFYDGTMELGKEKPNYQNGHVPWLKFSGWWFQSLWKIWKSMGATIPYTLWNI